MSRRIYCEGAGGQPCPSRAWFYYDSAPNRRHPGGRPRLRCPVCWAIHESARKRENNRNFEWKRNQLASAASGQGRGPEHISKPMGRVLEQIKGKVEGA